MDVERPIDPDGARLRRLLCRRAGFRVDPAFIEGRQVRGVLGVAVEPQIVPAVAGAAERKDLVADPDPGDLAFPVAFFPGAPLADEGGLMGEVAVPQVFQNVLLRLQEPSALAIDDLQGDAEGPHEARLRGDHDVSSRERRHGHRYGPVVTDAALHEDAPADRPVPFDPHVVVHGDRVDEPCQDVLPADAFVEGVLDVA